MAVEDFTTYTKVDPDGDIAVAAAAITVTTMDRDTTSYVRYVYPAATFDDFVHKVTINWTAASADTGFGGIWMVAESSKTFAEGLTNNEGLAAFLNRVASNQYRLVIHDFSDDGQDNIEWSSAPGLRYLTIQRIGTTLTCMVYTDASRTTLEDTLTLAVPTTAYAAVVPVFSRNSSPTDTPNVSYVVSDLDLQFTPGGTVTVQGGGDGGVLAIPQRSSISVPQQEARKPYLSLKQSMREFFSAHVRYLKDSNRKESVFEKPYRDLEYPSMHFGSPDPDWGGPHDKWWYTPGDWVPGKDGPGGIDPRPVLHCNNCSITMWETFNCEKDPVDAHASIWCTNTPMASTTNLTIPRELIAYNPDNLQPMVVERKGAVAGDTTIEAYALKGAIKEVTIGIWAYIAPSLSIFVDPTIAEHVICARMKDGAGNICDKCIDVNCACDCASVTSMTIDAANTDTTIAAGGTATVTVLDGCGNFTWNVTGTGYVIDSLVTQGRSNTIRCAAGVCGTAYGSRVLVTVTDACGISKETTILNTAGTWTQVDAWQPNSCKVGGTCACPTVVSLGTVYKSSSTKWPIRLRSEYCADCTGAPVSCGTKSSCYLDTTGGCGQITATAAEVGFPGGTTNCWGECIIPPGGGGTYIDYWECGTESCVTAGGACT